MTDRTSTIDDAFRSLLWSLPEGVSVYLPQPHEEGEFLRISAWNPPLGWTAPTEWMGFPVVRG